MRLIVQKVLEVKLIDGFDKETIICDDFSIDETLKVAKEWADTYPPIKVISNFENLGKT